MHEDPTPLRFSHAPGVSPLDTHPDDEPLELTQDYEARGDGEPQASHHPAPCHQESSPPFLCPSTVFGSNAAFETFAIERAGSINAFAGALAGVAQKREIEMPEGMEPIHEAVPSEITRKVQEMEEQGAPRSRIAALISAAADQEAAAFSATADEISCDSEINNQPDDTGALLSTTNADVDHVVDGVYDRYVEDRVVSEAPEPVFHSPVNALVRGEMPGAVSIPLREAGLLVDVTMHIQRGSIELHEGEDGDYRIQLSVGHASRMLEEVEAELGENERSMDELKSELDRRTAHAAELAQMKELLGGLVRD